MFTLNIRNNGGYHFHIQGYEQYLYDSQAQVEEEIEVGGLYHPETGEPSDFVECNDLDCTHSENQMDEIHYHFTDESNVLYTPTAFTNAVRGKLTESNWVYDIWTVYPCTDNAHYTDYTVVAK